MTAWFTNEYTQPWRPNITRALGSCSYRSHVRPLEFADSILQPLSASGNVPPSSETHFSPAGALSALIIPSRNDIACYLFFTEILTFHNVVTATRIVSHRGNAYYYSHDNTKLHLFELHERVLEFHLRRLVSTLPHPRTELTYFTTLNPIHSVVA